MGLLDSVQGSINRGVAGASRAGNTVKLKAQINEVLKRRQDLAAQLGASLYEATKDDPTFRMGREELYDGIASCDAERKACQDEISRIEAESAASQFYECPFCHARVAATSLFCSGCGKPMAEIQAAYRATAAGVGVFGVCPACGAPIHGADDVFCMSCGARLDMAQTADEASAEGVAAPAETPESTLGDSASISGTASTPDAVPAQGTPSILGEGPEVSSNQSPDDAPASVPETPLVSDAAPAPAPALAPFGVCPACGAPAKGAGDAFCMNCGARLDAMPSQPKEG